MSNIINLKQYVNNKNADKAYNLSRELENIVFQFFNDKNIPPHTVPNLHIALAVLKGSIDEYYGQDESELATILKVTVDIQKEIDDLMGRRMI